MTDTKAREVAQKPGPPRTCDGCGRVEITKAAARNGYCYGCGGHICNDCVYREIDHDLIAAGRHAPAEHAKFKAIADARPKRRLKKKGGK